MNQADYRNQFKQNVRAYEKTTQSRHIRMIYQLEKSVLERIFSEIGSTDKTAMDFACGSGRWTQFIEKCFKKTTGVDISEQMVQLARPKCSEADFIVTDITSNEVDGKLEGRQFDVITAFRFYKNAQHQLRQEVTSKLPKYLKPGGLFIFDLHLNSYSIMGIMASLIRTLRLHRVLGTGNLTVRTISMRTIRKLFENTPFEIIDYYGMGILPGRTNYTILPYKQLCTLEKFFTNRKLLRNYAYNILVIARKKLNLDS
jgi:SAM-dependent methyltransferase